MTDQPKQEPIVLRPAKFINTADCNPGTRVTMHLKVHSVKVTRERRRYEGTVNRSAECIVGDDNSCLVLIAKDGQLDIVKEGATITIRNAHANVVKEHLRLEIDRWAKVETADASVKIASVNTKNNLSEVAYELVPVDRK